MSSRRLQDAFSIKSFRHPRHLQDVLEDEKLLHRGHVEDIFKVCLEDILKTFENQQMFARILNLNKFQGHCLVPMINSLMYYKI